MVLSGNQRENGFVPCQSTKYPTILLISFIVLGMLSMIIQGISNPTSHIPIVGASGATAGIMGMYLILLPLGRIIFWFPPIFLIKIPAFVVLLFWIVSQYTSMRNSTSTGTGGIAWWAHIGGFCMGVLYALELRRKGFKPSISYRTVQTTKRNAIPKNIMDDCNPQTSRRYLERGAI